MTCPVCGNAHFDYYVIKLNGDHFVIYNSNFYLAYVVVCELKRIRAVKNHASFNVCTKCETCFS